jgi:GntR family transcriptional regulator, transcriptional repressor for pyruvate dehydrogenase complex
MSSDRNLANGRFRTVARESTLVDRVAEQVEGLIVGGQLAAGERLPSERELAEQFGVSRTVIREAVRVLAAKSLLEVRSGSGTVVRAPSARAISQSVTLLLRTGKRIDQAAINEVRRTLEVEIAGLAAQRRADEDVARLETLLADMAALLEAESAAAVRDRFTINDVQFHAALARATQNDLFVVLLDSIADVMLEVRLIGFEATGAHHDTLADHRAIFAQVRGGDADGARAAMRAHLANAERVILAGLERLRGLPKQA